MKDIDDTKQPLLEHLIELRKRLLLCLATLVITFFFCFYFAKDIFAVLVQPLLRAGQGKLIYTDIFEAFFTQVKVALWAALMLSFPVLAIQLWRFVAPGLYAKEKNAFLPFLVLTPFFFAAGACFAYFVAMPWALHFLLSFQGDIGGVKSGGASGGRQLFEFLHAFPVRLRRRVPAPDPPDDPRARGHCHSRATREVTPLCDSCRGCRRRRADPARRRFDALAADPALWALRTGHPRDPHHALASSAARGPINFQCRCCAPDRRGPGSATGGGRVGGSGPI